MSVFSCGFAKGGQLGVGPITKDVLKDPVLVEGLRGKNIVQVCCGDQSSFAITNLGDVYAWGRNVEGQLGQGNRTSTVVPVRIESLSHEKIIQIGAGSHHCVALTETGRIYTWGKLYKTVEAKKEDNAASSGDLGRLAGLTGLKQSMIEKSINRYLSAGKNEEEFQTYTTSKSFYQLYPVLIEELEDEFIVDISAGYSFSIAVSRSGKVFSWGFNDKAQLGLGHRYNQDSPNLITALEHVHVTHAVCGQQHVLVRSKDGNVFSWGLGVFGQLGHGNSSDSLLPKMIEEFQKKNIRVKKISCGAHHSVALLENGKVYSWGHGEYGQHGGTKNYVDWGTGDAGGKNNHFSTPRELSGLSNHHIIDIACGHLHNCAVTNVGACFTWGWGSSGCLGHGNTRFQLVPKRVIKFADDKIVGAACSWKHSLFLQKGSDSSFAFAYENLVNNMEYSDLVFNIQGRPIFAHKVFVYPRCSHLFSMISLQERFCGIVDEKGVTTLDIHDVTFPVFLGLMQYIYTDHLKLPPHQIVHLGDVAVRYRMPRLRKLCLKAVRSMSSISRKTTEPIVIPPSEFATQIRESLEENVERFSDLTFVNNDKSLSLAHRAILTRRCQFFSSMFASGFRESGEIRSTIHVDEYISPAVFHAFLDYLYTGDVNVITNDNVCELLGAADRYMVEELKQQTESIIEESIDETNVCWLLDLADRFNANRLKRACIDEITKSKASLERVKATEAYKDLRDSSIKLFREIDFLTTRKNLGHF